MAKIKRYNEQIQQYRHNRLFNSDQKKLFSELNGLKQRENEILDAEESRAFWSGIWSVSKGHSKNAEWLRELKEESNYRKQEGLIVIKEIIKQSLERYLIERSAWKRWSPGVLDKSLTSLHERIAIQLNEILNGNEQLIPEWMTYGRSVLCQKDKT